jgi:hypothetical protein
MKVKEADSNCEKCLKIMQNFGYGLFFNYEDKAIKVEPMIGAISNEIIITKGNDGFYHYTVKWKKEGEKNWCVGLFCQVFINFLGNK